MAIRKKQVKAMKEGSEAWFRENARHAERRAHRYFTVAPSIRANIEKAFRSGRRLSAAEAGELAFHMTDWIVDLEDLCALFENERWDPEEAQRVLSAFLIHVPWHVAAAHRIVTGEPVEDVFGIGAVKGTGKPRPNRPVWGAAPKKARGRTLASKAKSRRGKAS